MAFYHTPGAFSPGAFCPGGIVSVGIYIQGTIYPFSLPSILGRKMSGIRQITFQNVGLLHCWGRVRPNSVITRKAGPDVHDVSMTVDDVARRRVVEYAVDTQNLNLSAIRTIRVLRPLRAINRIPSELHSFLCTYTHRRAEHTLAHFKYLSLFNAVIVGSLF